jgi:hypothetical protein
MTTGLPTTYGYCVDALKAYFCLHSDIGPMITSIALAYKYLVELGHPSWHCRPHTGARDLNASGSTCSEQLSIGSARSPFPFITALSGPFRHHPLHHLWRFSLTYMPSHPHLFICECSNLISRRRCHSEVKIASAKLVAC